MKSLKSILVFSFLLTNVQSVLADATPKFTENIEICFNIEDKKTFDSIYIIVNCEDTITIKPFNTAEFWTKPTLSKKENNYIITSHSTVTSFQIFGTIQNQKYVSKKLTHFPGNSQYKIELSKEIIDENSYELKDNSNFLHFSWLKYFQYLLVTLFVEGLLGALILYFKKTRPKLTSIWFWLITINLITHITLWVIYTHFQVGLFFLEVGVIIAEMILFIKLFKTSKLKALLLSLTLNIASWIIGVFYI